MKFVVTIYGKPHLVETDTIELAEKRFAATRFVMAADQELDHFQVEAYKEPAREVPVRAAVQPPPEPQKPIEEWSPEERHAEWQRRYRAQFR